MIVGFQPVGLYDWCVIAAAAVVLLISVARLNDIKLSQNSKRWWARRVGLLLVFCSMAMIIGGYFTITTKAWGDIKDAMLLFGIMISWVTTPQQPPFWRYISRGDEDADNRD